MGVLISSAVIPITLTLLWSKQNKLAATIAPIFGFVVAMITWLMTTLGLYGEITVETSNQNLPMMAGNLVALFSPLLITIPLSLWRPDNFTFDETRNIQQVVDETSEPDIQQQQQEQEQKAQNEEEERQMEKSSRFAKAASIFLALALFILWPMPMFGSGYIFSLPFFRGWVIVSIIWVFFSTFAVGLFPLWEARIDCWLMCKAIWNDITGRRTNNLLPKVSDLSMDIVEGKDAVIVEQKKF